MRTCSVVIVLLAWGSPAWAQQPSAPLEQQKPITVERVENGFVVSPDYKLTGIDGDTGQLAGFSAGYLIDNVLFIGGAGYWMFAGAPGWDLSYGGLLVGVRMPGSERVAFGAKGLVGIGGATLHTTLPEVTPGRDWPIHGLSMGRIGHWPMPIVGGFDAIERRVAVSENFFVFEPQADLLFTITRRIRFGVSGGYRITAGVDALGSRLNGATGTLSVQFGLGGS